MKTATIIRPQREIPVIHDVDVCVIGGSCTGVFAAVRAARLGAKVVIVEKQNCFGGMATAAMVNIWHSIYDTEYRKQIIGGLSVEIIETLLRRNAAELTVNNPSRYCHFNSEELKIELDTLISNHHVIPLLHSFFCDVICAGTQIDAVVIENKSGCGAIRAKVFIDASGDGDLAAMVKLPFKISSSPQPPTTCARIENIHLINNLNLNSFINSHCHEFGMKPDTGWSCSVPGSCASWLYAATHVFDVDAVNAASLSHAEIEGRRHVRAIMDMLAKYYPEQPISLSALGSSIGIRESRHIETDYRLTEDDVLSGRRFDDAIANGSYRVDVHDCENGGFVFKYLDGKSTTHCGGRTTKGRWREETLENPTFYQIPYRTMTSKRISNLILAGRSINVDHGAFGAIRVMVNLNQTGEAAGVAAAMAADSGVNVSAIRADKLRAKLSEGGSVII